MKQTAVEWLFEKLDISQGYESAIELLEQAKEMEKEQTIKAYTHDRLMLKITAEQYYNETFKKE